MLTPSPDAVPGRSAVHPNELAVYGRFGFRPVRGEGCVLWDAAGRRFLDMYGGHAVAVTGHGHPRVVAAIRAQAERLLFYSNAVPLDPRDAFFDVLAELVPDGLRHAFLVNSGAEANEQALALARRVTGRSGVVSFEGGFHGRTLATLAASGIERYRSLAAASGGTALVAATTVCPFDVPAAARAGIGANTAAVIVEPVQGLAGAREASGGFLLSLRQACDEAGALLVFDEVQCGCGRSGAFTAAQAYGVEPDLLTLAKGIAGGLPMGALLVSDEVALTVKPGELGSTFGGGPVPCAAAAANLAVLRDERLAANASRMETVLRSALEELPGVAGVTGKGLLLGIVLDREARPVQRALLDRGVVVGAAEDPRVLRLLPPLVMGEREAGELVAALREVLS